MSSRGRRHREFIAARKREGIYDELVARDGESCALCGATPKTRRLNVDHDHRSMRVRALLCARCNRALPSWVTPEWLRQAAAYLERWQAAA